ncbi:hypothetical protein GOP47_0030282 [Adiantum capillus-veneris]|nr:hypothetical protein GOP47_0030282 [Adiantum capillus-veneris]
MEAAVLLDVNEGVVISAIGLILHVDSGVLDTLQLRAKPKRNAVRLIAILLGLLKPSACIDLITTLDE